MIIEIIKGFVVVIIYLSLLFVGLDFSSCRRNSLRRNKDSGSRCIDL